MVLIVALVIDDIKIPIIHQLRIIVHQLLQFEDFVAIGLHLIGIICLLGEALGVLLAVLEVVLVELLLHFIDDLLIPHIAPNRIVEHVLRHVYFVEFLQNKVPLIKRFLLDLARVEAVDEVVELLPLLRGPAVLILTFEIPEQVLDLFFKFGLGYGLPHPLIELYPSENALHFKYISVESPEAFYCSARHVILLQKSLNNLPRLLAPDLFEDGRVQRKVADHIFIDPVLEVVAVLLVEPFPKTNFELNCQE